MCLCVLLLPMTHTSREIVSQTHIALYATSNVEIMFGVDSFDSWKAKLEHNKGFLSRQDKKMTKHEKISQREG